MKSYRCIGICLLLGAASGFAAQAGVVHKWVDADGTTHYSDEAPIDAQLQVNRIEIDESEQAAVKSTDDYYSIANQWKRMHRERLERDRIALEKARLRASKQVVERVVVQQPATETRYLVDPRRRH